MTELPLTQAVARAYFLDAHLSKHGQPLGTLHGLGISVKEMLGMAGQRQCTGYCVKRLNSNEFFYWMEEREAYRTKYTKPVAESGHGRPTLSDQPRSGGEACNEQVLGIQQCLELVGLSDSRVSGEYGRQNLGQGL